MDNRAPAHTPVQVVEAESIESTRSGSRKPGARVSPRSLSPLTRQLIVDEVAACGDMDAVAKAHRLPIRTVDSVVTWFLLRKAIRPDGPAPVLVRRMA